MRDWRRLAALGLGAVMLLSAASGCAGKEGAGKKADPTAVTVWHYYNGEQLRGFDELVQEFNETVGAEQGIVVESHSYGGVDELNEKVLEAVQGKVGAEAVPDVFASYADTAYELNSMGKVADISQYLTEEEQAQYVGGYLDEGRFEEDGGFKIFPVAKSTELLVMNQTAWDEFAGATGADEGKLSTWEGITELAEEYYRWTDGLTPDVPDDGRAFFGRDAFANYIIIGSMQLGTELFRVADGKVTLQVDHDAMRRLWDNYYVPYVNGYFTASNRFRSDDMRTGLLACYIGSTSGTSFLTAEVTHEDGSTTPYEASIRPLPNFEGAQPYAVQQGAGMVVSKSTEARERSAVTFLKWFTQPEQNARFATASGYLPVTYAANDTALVSELEEGQDFSPLMRDTLRVGMEMTRDYQLYTSRAFENGYDARNIVDSSMRERAAADYAAVLELMAGGMSRADAAARFDTDENFEAWLGEFQSALEAAVH